MKLLAFEKKPNFLRHPVLVIRVMQDVMNYLPFVLEILSQKISRMEQHKFFIVQLCWFKTPCCRHKSLDISGTYCNQRWAEFTLVVNVYLLTVVSWMLVLIYHFQSSNHLILFSLNFAKLSKDKATAVTSSVICHRDFNIANLGDFLAIAIKVK